MPDTGGDDEESDGAADRGEDRQRIDVTAGDDLDDDGEDDQAEHVVGDGRPEHDPRLGGGEGAQVAEHSRRDADARRRERRTDEQRGVPRLAEAEGDAAAEHERHGDADEGDAHRRAADSAELGEVHLHPDLDEEQQHAELGERDDRLAVRRNPAEHRRPDDDADDDLADDGGDFDPLAQLGGELGGDEDHRQVEQHRPSVGTVRWSGSVSSGRRHREITPPKCCGNTDADRRVSLCQPRGHHLVIQPRIRAARSPGRSTAGQCPPSGQRTTSRS